MNHIKDGIFRAYFDGELDARERDRVDKHLTNCSLCEEKAAEVKSRGVYVNTQLQSLNPKMQPVTAKAARQRLADNINASKDKSRTPLLPFRYHPVWAAVTLVIIISFMMTFAPIRALANDFLALFRIQKFEFIEFNPLNLPNSEDSLRTAAMEIERLLNEEVDMTLHGDPKDVTQAVAQEMTNFTVRFPEMAEVSSRVTVQPKFDMVMKLDLAEIRTLFAAIGYGAVELPDTLDGAEIQATFENTVVTALGQCTENASGASASETCTVFIQTPSPSVTAPPELDLQQLGQLYLRILGMRSSQATRFSRSIDWTTTLVVPIPSTEATFKDVRVDGVPGTVIEGRQHNEVVLMWVKDDIVYALVGTGEADMLLNVARSID